nr:hypothetical protein [Tanacetum cinerariifolium]
MRETSECYKGPYDLSYAALTFNEDDADKDEEPFAGSDRGSKRIREGKEPESTSAQKEKESKTTGKSTERSKSYQKTASESSPAEEPMQTIQDLEEPSHQEFETAFLMNQLKVETLAPELLAGPTYELMKGSSKSLVELGFCLEEVYKAITDQLEWNNPERQQYPHNLLKPLPLITNSRGRHVIPFDHFINNDLEYLHGGASSRKYTTYVTKINVADYRHIKWIEDLVPRTMWSQASVIYDKYALWGISHWGRKRQQFYRFTVNRESARDVYSKRRIIAVTKLQIVKWHDYKHLDWITVRVESYQKNLNLTNPDTYKTDLKRKEAYTAYSNLRGFIYQNKDKQNRLMRIDKLHKFSDDRLNDVRTALDGRIKGIRMKYLPQTIWKRSDKERAAAMIQAIDKQLKTRRIM